MFFRPGVLYHPNVSKDGEICGDAIAKAFGPTKNVTDLARMVVAFMETPNLESPLEVRFNLHAFRDLVLLESLRLHHAGRSSSPHGYCAAKIRGNCP